MKEEVRNEKAERGIVARDAEAVNRFQHSGWDSYMDATAEVSSFLKLSLASKLAPSFGTKHEHYVTLVLSLRSISPILNTNERMGEIE